MKSIIDGKTYDPENVQFIASHDWEDLCRTAEGEFFVIELLRFLNGRRLAPHEKPTDATRAQWRTGFCARKRLVPLTPREAMIWCIKTQIPECFRGVLLESI